MLRARRRIAGQPGGWALSTEGLESLRGPARLSAVSSKPAPPFHDPGWNEADRFSTWRRVLRETQELPAILAAAVALDAWITLEPFERDSWLGRQFVADELRRRSKARFHLPALSLGLRLARLPDPMPPNPGHPSHGPPEGPGSGFARRKQGAGPAQPRPRTPRPAFAGPPRLLHTPRLGRSHPALAHRHGAHGRQGAEDQQSGGQRPGQAILRTIAGNHRAAALSRLGDTLKISDSYRISIRYLEDSSWRSNRNQIPSGYPIAIR